VDRVADERSKLVYRPCALRELANQP
jgi:hypothetical protein